ncbi:MAG: hypothetical protein AAFW46_02930 [Pseudomonadota bacterium]
MTTVSVPRRPAAFLASLLATALLLTACSTKEQTGQVSGGVAGGTIGVLVGQKLGGRAGAIIGGLIGAAAGVAIGGEIGRYLDERDREKAAAASRQAIAASEDLDGRAATQNWVSETNEGVSGSATAMRTSADCYTVQEVAAIPGRGDVRQETRYCRQGDGWVPA